MALIDKKENMEFGLSGDGFRFEDVKEAIIDFKFILYLNNAYVCDWSYYERIKLKKLAIKYNLDYEFLKVNEFDAYDLIEIIFGDFKK
jgi:hypothetical protein